MSVFNSSKNNLTIGVLWFTVLLLLVTPFLPNTNEISEIADAIGIIILYLISALLIWMLVDTKYKIAAENLSYCSGPIRGSIEINQIRKIERWNKWHVTSVLKPALDKDGLIIYYNKFDDIFISPKNKEDFINALREINPEIEVVL